MMTTPLGILNFTSSSLCHSAVFAAQRDTKTSAAATISIPPLSTTTDDASSDKWRFYCPDNFATVEMNHAHFTLHCWRGQRYTTGSAKQIPLFLEIKQQEQRQESSTVSNGDMLSRRYSLCEHFMKHDPSRSVYAASSLVTLLHTVPTLMMVFPAVATESDKDTLMCTLMRVVLPILATREAGMPPLQLWCFFSDANGVVSERLPCTVVPKDTQPNYYQSRKPTEMEARLNDELLLAMNAFQQVNAILQRVAFAADNGKSNKRSQGDGCLSSALLWLARWIIGRSDGDMKEEDEHLPPPSMAGRLLHADPHDCSLSAVVDPADDGASGATAGAILQLMGWYTHNEASRSSILVAQILRGTVTTGSTVLSACSDPVNQCSMKVLQMRPFGCRATQLTVASAPSIVTIKLFGGTFGRRGVSVVLHRNQLLYERTSIDAAERIPTPLVGALVEMQRMSAQQYRVDQKLKADRADHKPEEDLSANDTNEKERPLRLISSFGSCDIVSGEMNLEDGEDEAENAQRCCIALACRSLTDVNVNALMCHHPYQARNGFFLSAVTRRATSCKQRRTLLYNAACDTYYVVQCLVAWERGNWLPLASSSSSSATSGESCCCSVIDALRFRLFAHDGQERTPTMNESHKRILFRWMRTVVGCVAKRTASSPSAPEREPLLHWFDVIVCHELVANARDLVVALSAAPPPAAWETRWATPPSLNTHWSQKERFFQHDAFTAHIYISFALPELVDTMLELLAKYCRQMGNVYESGDWARLVAPRMYWLPSFAMPRVLDNHQVRTSEDTISAFRTVRRVRRASHWMLANICCPPSSKAMRSYLDTCNHKHSLRNEDDAVIALQRTLCVKGPIAKDVITIPQWKKVLSWNTKSEMVLTIRRRFWRHFLPLLNDVDPMIEKPGVFLTTVFEALFECGRSDPTLLMRGLMTVPSFLGCDPVGRRQWILRRCFPFTQTRRKGREVFPISIPLWVMMSITFDALIPPPPREEEKEKKETTRQQQQGREQTYRAAIVSFLQNPSDALISLGLRGVTSPLRLQGWFRSICEPSDAAESFIATVVTYRAVFALSHGTTPMSNLPLRLLALVATFLSLEEHSAWLSRLKKA